MSLITRCPACSTMFKVVADQLKVSEGWVRCGHCSEIFDAQAHFQTAETVPEPGGADLVTDSPDMVFPGPSAPQAAEIESATQIQSRPADFEGVFDPVPVPVPDAPVPAASGPEDFSTPVERDTPEPAPQLAELADEPLPVSLPPPLDGYEIEEMPRMALPGVSDPALQPSPLDAAFSEPLAQTPDQPLDELSAQALPDPEPGFVRQARRQAWWSRPMVRAVLAVLALILTMLLGLQVAVHERDRLAAWQPQTRPALQALCGVLDCRIQAWRQIESIQIESSAFNKLRADSYRLAFVLRNAGSIELAVPAMELTLTDAQDQALLRRVLQPADWPGAPAVLAGGAEWSASAALAIDAGLPRVSGYRLVAFYP